MKILTLGVLFGSLSLLSASAPIHQDPMAVDSTIYNIKMNNERVRVFVVVFKPGQSIAVHKHPDHVVHALQGGRLMIHEVGKDPVTIDVATGATMFLPAQSHSAKNMGKTTLRLLVTELK